MTRDRRAEGWSERANRTVHQMAQRADDTTGEVSARTAVAITQAVRLLRWPTAALQVLPVPFVAVTLICGLVSSGFWQLLLLVVGAAMAGLLGLFWLRRRRILAAVDDRTLLAQELQQLVNLTGRVDDATAVLGDVAGGGGIQVFRRLRGAWRGATLPAAWVDAIGELERARYFAPPRVGTTVWLTVATLWLVPISVVVALLSLIGTLAGSI